ncbi:MAG: hypothetical protein LBV53_03055 [Mycoplasmataceae bacterium]|jgi:glucan phosphoethanolaminetransferase (alkaline phosphatase superfamily)|nr:hypothetical protein [Mycoplasmataceae bacterium]
MKNKIKINEYQILYWYTACLSFLNIPCLIGVALSTLYYEPIIDCFWYYGIAVIIALILPILFYTIYNLSGNREKGYVSTMKATEKEAYVLIKLISLLNLLAFIGFLLYHLITKESTISNVWILGLIYIVELTISSVLFIIHYAFKAYLWVKSDFMSDKKKEPKKEKESDLNE